jgi:nucleotide-binding universal stress UspA family protein
MNYRILCAHDLSESSDPALSVALDLARRLSADLTVLFVSTPPYPAPPGLWFAVEEANFEGLAERIRAAAKLELEQRVKALARPGDPPVTVGVETGEPGETILATAADLGATMLVLGTHARKGWQHLMLGSVAERVVRTSPVPVLTVGPGVPQSRTPDGVTPESVPHAERP